MSLLPPLSETSTRQAVALGASVGALVGSSVGLLFVWRSTAGDTPGNSASLWISMAITGAVFGALVGAIALPLRAAAWCRTPRPVPQGAPGHPSPILQVPVLPSWLPSLVACGMSGGVVATILAQRVWWHQQPILHLTTGALEHVWLVSALTIVVAVAACLGTWGAVLVMGRLERTPGLTGRPTPLNTVLAVLAGLLGYAGGDAVGTGTLVLCGVNQDGMLAFLGIPLLGCLVGSLLYDAVHGVRLLRTVGAPSGGVSAPMDGVRLLLLESREPVIGRCHYYSALALL